MPAMPLSPAVELVITIAPPLPAASMAGMPAFTVLKTPVRLTAIISSQTLSSRVQVFSANEQMPAFAQITSSRPNSRTPSSTSAFRSPLARTSTSRANTRRSSSSTCRVVSLRSSGVASA
jgi:hypothetical protein